MVHEEERSGLKTVAFLLRLSIYIYIGSTDFTYCSSFTIIKSKLEEFGTDITVESFRCDFENNFFMYKSVFN